jgi:hypothetical protein
MAGARADRIAKLPGLARRVFDYAQANPDLYHLPSAGVGDARTHRRLAAGPRT